LPTLPKIQNFGIVSRVEDFASCLRLHFLKCWRFLRSEHAIVILECVWFVLNFSNLDFIND
jgi:hypothetical protein